MACRNPVLLMSVALCVAGCFSDRGDDGGGGDGTTGGQDDGTDGGEDPTGDDGDTSGGSGSSTSDSGDTGTGGSETGPTDTMPPTVSLRVNGSDMPAEVSQPSRVLFEAAAIDDIGVARVEFYADGNLLGTDDTEPYELDWLVSSVDNGGYDMTAKAIDASDNEAVSDPVFLSVQLPEGGSLIWHERLQGMLARDIVADANGNLTAVGQTHVTNQFSDIWVGQFAPMVTMPAWQATHDGPNMTGDEGQAVALGPAGVIAITGTVRNTSSSDLDMFVRTYTPMGNVGWTQGHTGTASAADRSDGIAIDGDGNVLMAGTETDTGQGVRVFARLFDKMGTPQWTHIDADVGNNFLGVRGAAVDSDGAWLLSGYEDELGGDRMIWVRKLMPGGMPLWTRNVSTMQSGLEMEGEECAFDPAGNVVVVGKVDVTGQSENVWLGKWSPDGNLLWEDDYDGGIGDTDSGYDVEVDRNGYVAVVGTTTESNANGQDIVVMRYDPDGNRLWTKPVDAFGGGFDEGTGVAVGPLGRIWVVGDLYVSTNNYEMYIGVYSP